MTALEQAAWDANIPHAFAEELLRERGGSLSPDELYQAKLLATGDPHQAAKARAKRWLEEHRPTGG